MNSVALNNTSSFHGNTVTDDVAGPINEVTTSVLASIRSRFSISSGSAGTSETPTNSTQIVTTIDISTLA